MEMLILRTDTKRKSGFKYILIVAAMMISMIIAFAGCSKGREAGGSGEDDNAQKLELNVFAAASLTDSLEEIKGVYEHKNQGVRLVLNFASSGALQKQIQQGAPADIFISAGKSNMENVVGTGEVNGHDVVKMLGNSMVVICSEGVTDMPKSLEDLKDSSFEKISIADPASAPAGRYAKESLDESGLFEELSVKTVYGKNVRQTLMYVEAGEVEAGIVYSSDVTVMEKGSVAFDVSSKLHSEIAYPAAVLKDSQNRDEAKKLMEFLKGEESSEIFIKNGFNMQED